MRKKTSLLFVLLIVCIAGFSQVQIPSKYSSEINKENVTKVLTDVADWQIANPLPIEGRVTLTDWGNATLYVGMADWAAIASSDKYYKYLKDMGEKAKWKHNIYADKTRGYNADDYCVGQTYIELYRKYNDKKMIEPIKAHLDQILLYPPVGGLKFVRFSSQRWTWIDALFMAPPVWAKMANVTGDDKYRDFMFSEFKASCEYLYDTEYHLWYEDSNWFDTKNERGQPVFWSRGVGWVMGGLPHIMQELPDSYENKNYFVTLLREMSAKLISIQNKNGSWSSDLLNARDASYTPEISGTAFNVYGLAYGVNNGYLDKEIYLPAIRKGWKAMVDAVWSNGKVGYIQPRGKGPKPVTSEMTEVYGVGAFLMAGTEISKMIDKGIF